MTPSLDQQIAEAANLERPIWKPILEINGVPAATFIKRAYDLGYDLDDPVQQQLRHIKGWIEMAERDALQARAVPEGSENG